MPRILLIQHTGLLFKSGVPEEGEGGFFLNKIYRIIDTGPDRLLVGWWGKEEGQVPPKQLETKCGTKGRVFDGSFPSYERARDLI